ncbi:ABC transporter permease [Vitiosangium sp. GDMCC 1.1324]|uniref:ABC transporter permease n=1 Tax=Vitiosangium sp. (strain GDMCC 1.1324) TaxID=2138576 RepID=UPI000D382F8B|nr:ABC transporter permease [Vitiosangium sp. GDMCC 1.1324]PTL85679.1 ABC transporter permease [Vitiosangium sp. GDMCC 1.1324]
MSTHRIWDSFVAIMQKEFVHVVRDRATLIAALAIPLFQLTLFGFLDQTVRHVPTVVVDQDRTSASRQFVEQLEATDTFRVVAVTSDPREARERIVEGRARVGVVLPPEFGAARAQADPSKRASVLVLIDGSDSVVSAQALAAVNGVAAKVNLDTISERVGAAAQPVIDAHPLVLFNPSGRTANYIIPGLVAILLQIVATVLTAVAIVREREKGTLEQLLVTPVHPLGLMLGKLAPYLILGMGEMALILMAMRFAFQVPIQGNLVFLFVMAVVYLFSLLSLGLFVSTRAKTQAQAQQLAQLFFLPSVFLSGYIFPASGLPRPLYAIGRVLPATHMVEIMRGVVLRGAGLMDLLPNVLALIAISTVLLGLSVRQFHKVTA